MLFIFLLNTLEVVLSILSSYRIASLFIVLLNLNVIVVTYKLVNFISIFLLSTYVVSLPCCNQKNWFQSAMYTGFLCPKAGLIVLKTETYPLPDWSVELWTSLAISLLPLKIENSEKFVNTGFKQSKYSYKFIFISTNSNP